MDKPKPFFTKTVELYFLLTFSISWIFWIPAALLQQPVFSFPMVLFMFGGGLSPMLAALIIVFSHPDRSFRVDYWKRLTEPRRIRCGWWAAICLLIPAITFLAVVLDGLSSGYLDFSTPANLLAKPLTLLSTAITLFLFGPLPEELGWRGIALDALQQRTNPLASSLILGTLWGIWHIPLFFMVGTYQAEIGFHLSTFGLFLLGTITTSVLITWIYNNTQRSILSAIFFHFMVNFSGEFFQLNQRAEWIRGLLILLASVIVSFWFGRKNMVRPYNYPHD